MTGWNDGYVTDVVYTRHAYREATPSWLAMSALLLGQAPPDLTQPFCYADLGCGHGLTATIVAATCPHAEVWAFDFNPAHIESGRQLAAAASLTNLHFQEASFAEIAAMPNDVLPAFDFIVSHGVASWVSPENRNRLVQIIGQRLRPGGLAYLSYNVATGWASMIPARALMRVLLRSNQDRTDAASAGILDYLDILKGGGAYFFPANPMVERRLAEARTQDGQYLAHEFLNEHWHPLMFADVADAMEAVKCTFIGSATLAENINAVSVPATMTQLLADASDPILRETLRDFGAAQTFRRDIYRRGTRTLLPPEHLRRFDAVELVWTGRRPEDPIQLGSPLGPMTGLPEVYGPLMRAIMTENQTIGALRQSDMFARRPPGELSQAITLLMSSGYLHPALPVAVRAAGRATTDRLNAAICAFNADGGDIPRLAASTIGSDVSSDILETLAVREKLSRHPLELENLTDRVLAALTRAGRAIQRDGAPARDMSQARTTVGDLLRVILTDRFPLLARLGAIQG